MSLVNATEVIAVLAIPGPVTWSIDGADESRFECLTVSPSAIHNLTHVDLWVNVLFPKKPRFCVGEGGSLSDPGFGGTTSVVNISVFSSISLFL